MDEKIDLTDLKRILDNMKESNLRSKDHYKFVIGLSTGALVFSVTFIGKISFPIYKPIILIGWVCLIISIITGVWLLPRRDSLEAQWKAIMDLLSKPENILFGIEQDVNKLMTRALISGFLREEMPKEPKDEEKIKELKKAWLTPNGRKGKAFLQTMISALEKIYPPLATAMPDITREGEKWEQLITKHGKTMYLPNMFKRTRETSGRVDFMEKAMTGFFYAGIILITLSSAINFLSIDVVDIICRLFTILLSSTP